MNDDHMHDDPATAFNVSGLPPNIETKYGRAWRLELLTDRPHSTIAQWLIYLRRGSRGASKLPGATLWTWFIAHAIHLRPVPGANDAIVKRPGATHELFVAALNPEHLSEMSVGPDRKWRGSLRYLTPVELAHQVTGLSDDAAVLVAEDLVVAYLSDHIAPDSDRRRPQVEFVEVVAAHWRGEHAVGDA